MRAWAKEELELAMRNAFLRKDDGNMSIEVVLMVPLFVVMMTGTMDLSRVYIDQSNAYSAVRDTARLVGRHAMSEESAEAYLLARMSEVTNAQAASNVSITGSTVVVSISAPISAIAKFGFLKSLNEAQMIASVTHPIEPL